jgi:hypothetical protein
MSKIGSKIFVCEFLIVKTYDPQSIEIPAV